MLFISLILICSYRQIIPVRQFQQLRVRIFYVQNIPELFSSTYPYTLLETLYSYMMLIVEPVCSSELLKIYRHVF